MKKFKYLLILTFSMMLFSCSDDENVPVDKNTIVSNSEVSNSERNLRSVSIYESQSFKNLMRTLSVDNQLLMTYNSIKDEQELSEYNDSLGLYADEINQMGAQNLSLQDFKNIANTTFDISFDGYLDSLDNALIDFFSEHLAHFENLTEPELTLLLSEAVEMYITKDLGLSLDNRSSNGRNSCAAACQAAWSNCQSNAAQGWATGLTSTFTIGFTWGVATGFTGPGALGTAGSIWLGGTITNTFGLGLQSLKCWTEYNRCMQGCGGGNEENGPIPFGDGG